MAIGGHCCGTGAAVEALLGIGIYGRVAPRWGKSVHHPGAGGGTEAAVEVLLGIGICGCVAQRSTETLPECHGAKGKTTLTEGARRGVVKPLREPGDFFVSKTFLFFGEESQDSIRFGWMLGRRGHTWLQER